MLAAAGAAALAGCGRARAAGGLSFWAEDSLGEMARVVMPDFTRTTGLPVDLQWLSWTAAHQKLITAAVAGDLPDVLMLKAEWMAEFRLMGALRPAPAALLAPPALAAPAPGAGPAYGVPWVVDTNVQYYRRDLLARAGYDAPPSRWDDWRRMLHAVKRRTGAPYAVLMQLNWPEHLFTFLAQAPEPLLLDADTRGGFSQPGVLEALGVYRSLFDEGLAPRVTGVQADDPTAELARGWTATYSSGYWQRADLLRRPAEIARDLWAVAPQPGPQGPGRGVVLTATLAVSRDSRTLERGWRLVDHLFDPAVQARLFSLCGALPSHAAAWQAPALAGDPALPAFADQLSRARAGPAVLEWPRIEIEVQAVAERMARGDLSVAGAAARMDEVADRLLAKRRALLDRGRPA